jgi:hypothetical protein
MLGRYDRAMRARQPVGGPPFTPRYVFRTGAQGVWYDPSDFSTLFQDAAGTIPVTAVEQPVGLMLDKSKGLVLGAELVTNGTFDADISGWTARRSAVITHSLGRIRVTNAGGVASGGADQPIACVIGKSYRLTLQIADASIGTLAFIRVGDKNMATALVPDFRVSIQQRPVGIYSVVFTATQTEHFVFLQIDGGVGGAWVEFDNVSVRELAGNHAIQATATSRPILRARYNLLTATETLATQSTTTVATTHRLLFSGAGTITLSGTATGTYTAGTHNITCTSGTLTLTVSGTVTRADLRPTNDALTQPNYQRVTTSTNYDTVGFMPYLETDGVDDWMSTSNINFTGSDKVTAVAGMRKLSDAAVAMLAEFGSNAAIDSGSFAMVVSPGAAPRDSYGWRSKGTVQTAPNINGFVAPHTAVIRGIGDIGRQVAQINVNGVAAVLETLNQGTGNYGNYPLFLFRRDGTTLPFNGRMYGLAIINRLLAPSDLTKLETFINNKTKAY